MHGVRVELQKQAESIGLPLEIMYIQMPTMEVYEKVMIDTLTKLKSAVSILEIFF
jgi:hypothetical protein